MNTSELANALQRLAAEATAPSPPATPAPAPAPAPPAPITSLSQLLSPDTIAALAQLDASQRAAAQAAEANVERAWDAFEQRAFGPRPQAHDAPAGGSALAAAGAPHDPAAWLRGPDTDLLDVRTGWGEGPTY